MRRGLDFEPDLVFRSSGTKTLTVQPPRRRGSETSPDPETFAIPVLDPVLPQVPQATVALVAADPPASDDEILWTFINDITNRMRFDEFHEFVRPRMTGAKGPEWYGTDAFRRLRLLSEEFVETAADPIGAVTAVPPKPTVAGELSKSRSGRDRPLLRQQRARRSVPAVPAVRRARRAPAPGLGPEARAAVRPARASTAGGARGAADQPGCARPVPPAQRALRRADPHAVAGGRDAVPDDEPHPRPLPEPAPGPRARRAGALRPQPPAAAAKPVLGVGGDPVPAADGAPPGRGIPLPVRDRAARPGHPPSTPIVETRLQFLEGFHALLNAAPPSTRSGTTRRWTPTRSRCSSSLREVHLGCPGRDNQFADLPVRRGRNADAAMDPRSAETGSSSAGRRWCRWRRTGWARSTR